MEKAAIRLVNYLVIHGIAKEENRDIFEYGLYMMLSTLLNMVVSVGIGMVFRVPLHVLLFLLSFMIMRKYAGGYHAESPIACAVISYAIVLAHIAAITLIPQPVMQFMIVPETIIPLILVFRYAPIEHKNAPLSDMEKKIYRRRSRMYVVILPLISIVLYIIFENTLWLSILHGSFTSALLMLAIKIRRR